MRSVFILAALAATPALADTTYIISVSNRITEVQPSATVDVWAVFDENLYSFADAAFDVALSADPGMLSSPHSVLNGLGAKDGELAPNGDSVSGIVSAQICGGPDGCWEGDRRDTSNPILAWSVTWSTTDFSARTVALATFSKQFDVYIDAQGTSKSFLGELVEGSGLIEVGCYADFTGDGALDLFDFLCFVNAFNAGC